MWQPDPPLRARLQAFLNLVLLANQHQNLIGPSSLEEAWVRHILDSLQGLQTPALAASDSAGEVQDLQDFGSWASQRRASEQAGTSEQAANVSARAMHSPQPALVDVGSGAGFPGLVLALARPELQVTLVEATAKKCAFLRLAADQLGLAVQVLNRRAEAAGQDPALRQLFDVATARAVGSLAEVCELTLPLVKVAGCAVLWRGPAAEHEVRDSAKAIRTMGGRHERTLSYRLPALEPVFHLVVVRKVRPTPARYPRSVGVPHRQPLGQVLRK